MDGTTNLINKLGDPINITTHYTLDKGTIPGATTLTLEDSWGIPVGAKLTLAEEEVKVIEVSGNVISISTPIQHQYKAGDRISSNQDTVGLSVPRFKRVTYELLEFIRKLRVPQDSVVNYGSIVTHMKEQFFVVGIDPGDASYSIALREINRTVTIERMVKDDTGKDSWGPKLIKSTIASGVPAYLQYMLADLPFREGLGYVPIGSYLCIIPREYEILLEDKIVDGDTDYKVVGFDPYTNKNLMTLILGKDASK